MARPERIVKIEAELTALDDTIESQKSILKDLKEQWEDKLTELRMEIRRDENQMELLPESTPVISINMDKKCKGCGEQGALESGYCVLCATEKATGRKIPNHGRTN